MSQSTSEEIVNALATEIGPDASYFRAESERLYLSGIEIATLIGTGVLLSFCVGLFEGVKKGVTKHAEKLGEDLVDSFVKRLKTLLERVSSIKPHKTDELLHEVDAVYHELDGIVLSQDVVEVVVDNSSELYSYEVQEVTRYLQQVGFPEGEALERAEILVVLIQREWHSR